jgi:hypothetical protein
MDLHVIILLYKLINYIFSKYVFSFRTIDAIFFYHICSWDWSLLSIYNACKSLNPLGTNLIDIISNDRFLLQTIDYTGSVVLDFSFMHIIVPLIVLILIYIIITRFLSFFSLIPIAIYQILIDIS